MKPDFTGACHGKVLVTGANGFIGAALLARLVREKRAVTGSVRGAVGTHPHWVAGPELGPDADWRALLAGTEVVIHTAARVHRMREAPDAARAAHLRVNTQGSLALARQAATAGVKRFIFISTLKVMGEETQTPLQANTPPSAHDPYAESKLAAERGLAEIGRDSGMAWVIIRPPLVYGPGVGGNFAAMMRALARGLPLPLGAVTGNRRSLVGLDNLVDLIVRCIDHPAAANQTFLVSDGEDLSTAELLARLGAAMGKPARLLNMPPSLLSMAAALVGKRAVAQRLLGSLQVDIGHTCRTLDWAPPVGVDEGLRRAVRGWTR